MRDENLNKNNIDFNVNKGTINNERITKRVIKTYRDFAVEALDDKPTSLAQMIIKEKKKQDKREKKSIKNPKNIFMIILSVILIILGIGAFASIVIFMNLKHGNIEDKKFKGELVSTLNYDYKKVVIVNDIGSIENTYSDLYNNTNLPFGSIKNIFFVKKNKNGYQYQLKASEFLTILDTRVPDQFIRNLLDRFSVGIVYLGEPKPFLILETHNFNASLLNMSAWEKTMLYDIGTYFNVNQKYYSTGFEDMIYSNKDVRAILDSSGSLVFGYAFLDSHKIILFTDPKVLKTVLTNLRKIIKK